MSKISYYCPFDDNTKIIRIPTETNKIYTQIFNDKDANATRRNPSKVFKFAKCKTSEPAVHRNSKAYKAGKNTFYRAKDVWEFDNVGVSKPPSDLRNAEIIKLESEEGDVHNFAVVRYLVCGHCDQGAFGFGGYSLNHIDEEEEHVEIGYDLAKVSPNDLVYFFYF